MLGAVHPRLTLEPDAVAVNPLGAPGAPVVGVGVAAPPTES